MDHEWSIACTQHESVGHACNHAAVDQPLLLPRHAPQPLNTNAATPNHTT